VMEADRFDEVCYFTPSELDLLDDPSPSLKRFLCFTAIGSTQFRQASVQRRLQTRFGSSTPQARCRH
jgi:hypothetical protein